MAMSHLYTTMSDTINQNESVAQLQDIMNPATFVPPTSQLTPRVVIEFCDMVRELTGIIIDLFPI